MDCKSLNSIEIPNSVTSIGKYAFYNCFALKSVRIPDTIYTIKKEAFYACRELTSLTIPKHVTSISDGAFNECKALIDVYYLTDRPIEESTEIFSYSTYNNATLWVPEGAVFNYQNTNPWNSFSTIKEFDNSNVNEVMEDVNPSVPYEVYTMEGVKIENNEYGQAPGIYIIRQGDIIKKIAVK